MELSTNFGYALKQRGKDGVRDLKEAAKMVKDAGFNYVDFGVERCAKQENWKELIEQARNDLEKTGLKVNQTHAPYNFIDADPEEYKERMRRCFEASYMLGAENIVIHADKYVPDENGYDADVALNEIYDFYAPYVEYAKKVGLNVAVENLFENPQTIDTTKPVIRSRFTSKVEEQIAIIEKFNDPLVTACWDFGHGQVSYRYNYMEGFKKIGPYLTSTHVHDNVWGWDLHQIPFHGDINWEEVMAYMKEINYKGKFTMEMVYGSIPDALLPHHLKLWYETGKYLASL